MNKQCIWCCRTPFPRQQQQHQSSSKRFLKLVLPNYKIDPSTGNFCRLDHDGSFNYRAVNISALPFRRNLTDGVVLLILLLIASAFCCFRFLFAAIVLEQLFVSVVIGIIAYYVVCGNISFGEIYLFNSVSTVYFPLDFGMILVEEFEGFSRILYIDRVFCVHEFD